MKLSNLILLFLPSTLIAMLFSLKTGAQGNLLLTPGRIVFEGQKRMQEVNLANNGKDTATYLVSFIEIRMKEDGTFEQISQPDSGQHFASSYLRFFPRRVILAPNEAQNVKVQLTKSSKLSPGEYRSHMYFRAVPEEVPLGTEVSSINSKSLVVKLTPVFGISIPVIIRVGELAHIVSLSGASLNISSDSIPVLDLVLNRSGDKSTYGDLKIEHISFHGKATVVAEVKGIAVYTPTLSRRVKIKLQTSKGVNYKTGKLHVMYFTSSDQQSIKLAETELTLY
ncbi:hypothetical protein OKW96_15975 [Sphingobacterium sp. KU25419]|nr:hypothetical protein OKW96_15975 [Sphingobacterium sp. KU25419]